LEILFFKLKKEGDKKEVISEVQNYSEFKGVATVFKSLSLTNPKKMQKQSTDHFCIFKNPERDSRPPPVIN